LPASVVWDRYQSIIVTRAAAPWRGAIRGCTIAADTAPVARA
jgi:hypothetical protein